VPHRLVVLILLKFEKIVVNTFGKQSIGGTMERIIKSVNNIACYHRQKIDPKITVKA
jgi:hypothetical protein